MIPEGFYHSLTICTVKKCRPAISQCIFVFVFVREIDWLMLGFSSLVEHCVALSLIKCMSKLALVCKENYLIYTICYSVVILSTAL